MQNLYILVKVFGKIFIFSIKSTIFSIFQDQMKIFGYKTTIFIQNLYILVKLFGQNFIFRVKSTNILFFQDQMYIFGYKTTVFIQNLYILVKFFGKNFIFRVKSTNVLVFRNQMYIFGYKTTVFIQNLYILVKYIGKNFIFSVKSTLFWGEGTKCTFLGTKLHFLSKICTFLKFFDKNANYRVKSFFCFFKTKFNKTTVFIQNLHILVYKCTFLGRKLFYFVHFGEFFCASFLE